MRAERAQQACGTSIRALAGTCSVAALLVVAAACGDDDRATSATTAVTTVPTTVVTSTTVAATTTSRASTTTTPAATTTAASAFDAEQQAAATAFTTVFDSATPFDAKVPFLEEPESLRATNAAYAAVAEGVGGIAVEPTAVTIATDGADVTYRVLFAGNEAYAGLTAEVTRGPNGWIVPNAAFCAFMASARTPCQG